MRALALITASNSQGIAKPYRFIEKKNPKQYTYANKLSSFKLFKVVIK